MVDHFEVGHYYRWVGPMGFSWSFEEMGEWADGKPRECIYKHSEGGYWFEKIDGGIWCYDAICLPHVRGGVSSIWVCFRISD
jgi:hypothetical protein